MVACSGCIMVKHAGIKLHLMLCHSFSCVLFNNLIFLSFSKTKKAERRKTPFCFAFIEIMIYY